MSHHVLLAWFVIWLHCIDGTGAQVNILSFNDPVTPSSSNSPTSSTPQGDEGPRGALVAAGKYLNYDKLNTGFTVMPAVGPTRISAIGLTSSSDAALEPARSPTSWTLEGSDDGVAFESIGSGTVAFTGSSDYLAFPLDPAPGQPYAYYRVTFPTIVDPATANSMQIGQVQLFEVTPSATPSATRSPTPASTSTAQVTTTSTSTPTPTPTSTSTGTSTSAATGSFRPFALLNFIHTSVMTAGDAVREQMSSFISATGTQILDLNETGRVIGLVVNNGTEFTMPMPLPSGEVSNSATVSMGNFSASSAVIVARTPNSTSMALLNLTSPSNESVGAQQFLFTIDRLNATGGLVTEEDFTFSVAASVTELVVFSYRTSATEGVEVTSEGGSITSFGNGTFLVTSTHTSSFAGFAAVVVEDSSSWYWLFLLLLILPIIGGILLYHYKPWRTTPSGDLAMPHLEFYPDRVAPAKILL